MDERLKPAAELLTAEELARLSERARLDVHSGIRGRPDAPDLDEEAEQEHEYALFARGLTGLRLAARVYALKRDAVGLTPIVWGAWALSAEHWEGDRAPDAMLTEAVRSIGDRVLEVPGLAERLARSPLAAVRGALADALPPSSAAILHALASDPDAAVRAAAAKKVEVADEWGGAFPIAPDGHPRDVLEAAREILDLSAYHTTRDPERAVGAFAPLSDPLAVACWERLLSGELVIADAFRPWAARLLEREGGGAALARVFQRVGDDAYLMTDERWLGDALTIAPELRARAIGELLASIRALEAEQPDESDLQRHALANAIVFLAPEQGDTRALLETILGSAITEADEGPPHDTAAVMLSPLLARWPLDEAVSDAMWRARRAGKPGRWRRVGADAWKALGPDPVIREKAWADLDAEDPAVRGAAVAALLGEHHDPAGESVAELAMRLYERPALRRAVPLGSSPALLERARRDLEAGQLDLYTAVRVLVLTPPEERTDAMWTAARALRDHALASDDRSRSFVMRNCESLIRRGDAWDPSDLAYAQAIADFALADEIHASLLELLVMTVARIDAPETDTLLGAIEARATTPHLAATFRDARAFVHGEQGAG